MNDLGTPPPDWDRIFDRAHSRIVGRFILVGTIGALCAVLLLGGGLSAQGAVSLGIGGNGNGAEPDANHTAREVKAKAKAKAKARHRKRMTAKRHAVAEKHHKKTSKKKKHHGAKHHPTWNPCAGESGSSAEQQYCEGIEDSAPTGETGTSDTAKPEGANNDQQAAPPKNAEVTPAG